MEHAGGGWQYPDIENAARQFGEGRPDVFGGREWGAGKSALIQRAVASFDSSAGTKRVSANAMFGRHQAISRYSETHYDVKAFGPVAGQSHLNKMRDMS